jgi:nucleoside-diphosphate-sugar epimerase
MWSDEKVLITGAGGFIGGRVVEVMYLTRSLAPRAGVRSWASAARVGRFPVEIFRVDLLNKTQIDHATEGVSYVVHCAYGPGGATVEGTRNLIEVVASKPIKGIVHLSTIAVYGNAEGYIDENHTCSFSGNEYADSKLEAEKICLRYAEQGTPITILRLPIVYGPFSRNWTIHMGQMLANSSIGFNDSFEKGKCNLLYIDDLVVAICKVLSNRRSVGQILNVNGPAVLTWNEYFRRFNDGLGLAALEPMPLGRAKLGADLIRPVRLLGKYIRNNHAPLLKRLAATSPTVGRCLMSSERTLRLTPIREDLALFSRDAVYSYEKIRMVLGFEPQVGVDEGLRHSCDWLHQQGFQWFPQR